MPQLHPTASATAAAIRLTRCKRISKQPQEEPDVGELELELSADIWDIEVRDYERAGGFVRLNVTEAVRAWLAEDQPNEGLVFTTEAVSANSLGGQASGVRLVLR